MLGKRHASIECVTHAADFSRTEKRRMPASRPRKTEIERVLPRASMHIYILIALRALQMEAYGPISRVLNTIASGTERYDEMSINPGNERLHDLGSTYSSDICTAQLVGTVVTGWQIPQRPYCLRCPRCLFRQTGHFEFPAHHGSLVPKYDNLQDFL